MSRYTIELAAAVPGALIDACAAGVPHPAPRWSNDRTRAIITWRDDDAPPGAMDDAALAAELTRHAHEWTVDSPWHD